LKAFRAVCALPTGLKYFLIAVVLRVQHLATMGMDETAGALFGLPRQLRTRDSMPGDIELGHSQK
jgi:hypothetical protein